ncbi:hypothetical protein N7476_008541 [Penicillium atrosanguineum]|uniref:Secreted protein n=1 Tax=Penicillium atrosanguineum TaxID=1132637 RepID=A0A9W9PTQ9_9EURO|nr:hypothetical protein N7476_008541 [Penicillium atrosanguineum]
MKLSTLFFAALLGETARAYNLGDKATGTTDPDVTENCSQWANSIASGDTCKKLEADFNIDYLQLHEWASYQSTLAFLKNKTNSLAKLVGTEAPTLKNPNYTDSSSSSSATTTTATSSSSSSSSTNSTVTASLNSIATSTATESSSAQQTGNAASSGLTAIPIVMLFVAFSALALQLN